MWLVSSSTPTIVYASEQGEGASTIVQALSHDAEIMPC